MKLVTEFTEKRKLLNIYSKSDYFFPVIAAVLNGTQNGLVFVSETTDSNFIVVHKFGFAQLITSNNDLFQKTEELNNWFLQSIQLNGQVIPKLRFYCAQKELINLVKNLGLEQQVGERIRFKLDVQPNDQIDSSIFSEQEIEWVNKNFELDLFNRFWTSKNDFINGAFAYVCKNDENKIVSICYGAASEGGYSEIDIYTNELFRNQGWAKKAVKGFIFNCLDAQIMPLWDCYSNNVGSVQTALSVGFKESYRYNFLIVTKDQYVRV